MNICSRCDGTFAYSPSGAVCDLCAPCGAAEARVDAPATLLGGGIVVHEHAGFEVPEDEVDRLRARVAELEETVRNYDGTQLRAAYQAVDEVRRLTKRVAEIEAVLGRIREEVADWDKLDLRDPDTAHATLVDIESLLERGEAT